MDSLNRDGGSERDVWRQARQQISDYENQLLERQLDIKHEATALEVETSHLRDLQAELNKENDRIHTLENQVNEQRVLLLSLHKTKTSAESNICHLQEQHLLLNQEISLLERKAEEDRVSFAEHVQEEQEIALKFSEHSRSAHVHATTG